MSFATNIADLATRIGTEFKAIRVLISGSGTGGVSGLTTTATNLVAAINEVKAAADSAAGGGVDLATVQAEAASAASAAVNGLVDGAPDALNTLNEFSAAINDNASFGASITATLGQKANTSDVYTQAQLGDPTTNYVATFEAALT
ncbi:MAG: hypothetical protein AAGH90_13325 [Pseudomonadota bacterium]